ncbi:MAG: erythromycin esterase family protein [Chloroflexota bacterium]|nr:erythromycin esterase family protein [Chloroflexota bacterium]
MDPHADPTLAAVRAAARPLTGVASDLEPLLALAGQARVVCLGEATHGTHDFYEFRAELTKRLIAEQGFSAVAVEADWPDAARVDRYVRGGGGAAATDDSAEAALGDFVRFPRWMWRNTVVRDFVAWLRAHNDALPSGALRTGFYGLDLYSLRASMEAVVGYLEAVDPAAADRARRRYGCFDHADGDPQDYGLAASFGAAEPCEEEVVAQLQELRRRAAELAGRDGRAAEDAFFGAEQNARLAKNAEAYYRAMFRGRVSSWNLRDRHMAETLDALLAHLDRSGGRTKAVVWAHNSHLGDARATRMGEAGELNLGQLVRERHGREAVLVGFSTASGTVTAADDWDAPPERMIVRPALPNSFEALFHEAGQDGPGARFVLTLREGGEAAALLREPRLQRAIGVVYRPQTERISHYYEARLADQFDAVVHIDRTRAVEPLERDAGWDDGEPAETYPFGE